MGRDQQATRLYYGWYIAMALAVTETISWGILYYTFSVFITPMEAEFGWSRTQLSAAFSLAILVRGAMAYPVGSWIDQHGARSLMTVGSIVASLLVIAWSQVQTLPALYAIWAGLGICAATVLYDPAFAVVAKWFIKRRGRALAIITFAAGLASTIFVPLADVLRQLLGWRDAVLVLGIFLAITTIPLHWFVLRRFPADVGLLPDGESANAIHTPAPASFSVRDALHNRLFWLLTLAFSVSLLTSESIRVHFIPMLIDSGIDASTAAFASGAIGIMQLLGRIFFAPLEERYSARAIVTVVFAMQLLAALILLPFISVWTIGAFLLVFGTSYGAWTLARASVVADMFGTAHYGRISSVMSIFFSLATTIAPLGGGIVYDYFGNYQPMLLFGVVFSSIATGIMWFSRKHFST